MFRRTFGTASIFLALVALVCLSQPVLAQDECASAVHNKEGWCGPKGNADYCKKATIYAAYRCAQPQKTETPVAVQPTGAVKVPDPVQPPAEQAKAPAKPQSCTSFQEACTHTPEGAAQNCSGKKGEAQKACMDLMLLNLNAKAVAESIFRFTDRRTITPASLRSWIALYCDATNRFRSKEAYSAAGCNAQGAVVKEAWQTMGRTPAKTPPGKRQ